jgi:hypothetical protein
MPSQAWTYLEYARECIRLAGHAESTEQRDKLVDLARVWMDAAMAEDEAAGETAAKTPAKTAAESSANPAPPSSPSQQRN